MALSPEQVQDIAELARLQIDSSKIADYQQSLSNILDLFNKLSMANIEAVEPMTNPLDAVQRLRPDIVTAKDQREQFQKIAPQTEDGYYLVPRVVE
ncbi:MAG: Asp-tRNA(Asn)/Glu-tRNA(Gln) amidotransferase subunit GatC [Venatoribacter sp.]